jgi:putative membrane protein
LPGGRKAATVDVTSERRAAPAPEAGTRAMANEDDPTPQPDPRPWWEQGEEPDYRATLANERTFLAWSRTALALLASAFAVVKLIPGTPSVLRLGLACYLIALSVGTTVTGYLQWRSCQRRMRHGLPLGHSPVQALLGLAFLGLAGVVAAVAAFSLR